MKPGISNVILACGLSFSLAVPLQAQTQQEKKKPGQDPKPSLSEGLPKRKLNKQQEERRQKAIQKELKDHYKRWLEEDVVYIIVPEEKDVFAHLSTEEEREQFIEQFWFRRDPTPDTLENEYKEEHYRRIAYANERYGVGKPGWLSDRGRIYIMHGRPDEIASRPTGDLVTEDVRYGSRRTSVSRAFEIWRYNYVQDVGQQIEIEFVDRNGDGDYKLTLDPTEKEVFTSAGALSRLYEPKLLTDSGDATTNPFANRQFDMLENMSRMMAMDRAPEVKFKDLETLVTTRISFNLLPYEIRTHYFRITDTTILVPVTLAIAKEDMQFTNEEGIHQAVINVFGRITSLTGRVISTFEDVIQVSVPDSIFQETLHQKAIYQKAIPLRPGLYKLNLVLKDLGSGNVGTMEERLTVPRFEDGELSHSSLVLADLLEKSSARQVGTGQFVIGETKVRPSVGEEFRQSQKMGIYLQVYNLPIDETSRAPSATFDYTITKGEEVVFHHTETTAEMENAGSQVTLEKMLPLESFELGKYKLHIKITDQLTNQESQSSVEFKIIR